MTSTDLPALPHRFTPGSARAALSWPAYRLIWLGMFASNIGSWMQNVALPAYIQDRTRSGSLVALMVFGQLGPVLFLSIPGGIIAARFRPRPWLVTMQSIQLAGSVMLAVLAANHASVFALFWCNTAIGIGGALTAPTIQSLVPMLVDRRGPAGAISLNSTQLNGSRVIGPLIVGILGLWGVSLAQIFLINAATYLFMIAALVRVPLPAIRSVTRQGWRQLTHGLQIARSTFPIGRVLATMALFSFFSLPYIGLFPTVADEAFGIEPASAAYKWLYAVWGLGACLGALSTATILARIDKARIVRPALIGFAVSLGAFAVLRSPALAYPVGFVLGWWYFLMITALITVLQQALEDHQRPAVMALWFMCFGGTVPLGNLAFGPLMDVVGPHWVLAFGALVAVGLGWWCDLRDRPADIALAATASG